MVKDKLKVVCETPTAGKQGTRIAKWKYDAVRTAIRKAVPKSKDGVEFQHLASMVKQFVSPEDRDQVGLVSWYTTAVKLDMEVRGEIDRVPGSKPQRIRRVR